MNAGNVNGYDNTYATDAAAFNSQDHHKTDSNFDFTATTRFEASSENAYELGLARKSQSPNLYERYAWSTNGMAAAMVNWYGNAVGYVGNLNLRPQTANTASTSAEWHDAANKDWNVKVTPYYTYVQNYIGVNYLKTDMMMGTIINQFANHDAQIYGFDLSGKKLLLQNPSYRQLRRRRHGRTGARSADQQRQQPLSHAAFERRRQLEPSSGWPDQYHRGPVG